MSALTFCGASVLGFNSRIGWNEQQSEMTIKVVEDTENGDFFNPPPVGTPVFFSYGAFTFYGLLQKWTQSNNVDGFPTFELQCIDPKEILAGAQLITGAYRGVVPVQNLFNVFGWWENLTGFGSSLSNTAGMQFNKVYQALNAMANSPTGLYGRNLIFRGVAYGLDLSELPVPPIFYRVPTPNISLLELISQLCADSGCDYFVELVGYTIKIRTVSRVLQPTLGVITAVAESGYGIDTLRSSSGLESRNEVTSAFVVGGPQTTLYTVNSTALDDDGNPIGTNAILPFWGFDTQGNAILGTGTGDSHAMLLNCSEVADVVGDVVYPCTVGELRQALSNFNTWAAYMRAQRKAFADRIKLIGPFDLVRGPLQHQNEGVRTTYTEQQLRVTGVVDTIIKQNSQRMYAFVQKIASEYMGKKFLASIPFSLHAIDQDTLKVIYSQEVSTEGGFLAESASPLGLPTASADQFKTKDGRFEAFALYSDIRLADLSKINTANIAVGDDGISLYVKCQVNPAIVQGTDTPAVVVTVDNPIYDIAPTLLTGTTEVANAINRPGVTPAQTVTPAQVQQMLQNSTQPLFTHPAFRQPDSLAIPLKSNVLTYGPWYDEGAFGKVSFRYDESLTPWQYGDYATMNLAGLSNVSNAITHMVEGETGTIDKVGLPAYGLADLLQGTGPNITNIDVSYGSQGITTSYGMRTFSPAYGIFSKQNADRIKRLGTQTAELRKYIRAVSNQEAGASNTLSLAVSPPVTWLQNMPGYIRRDGSPHDCLVGYAFPGVQQIDIIDSGSILYTPPSGAIRVTSSSQTMQEMLTNINSNDNNQYVNTAAMNTNGLLRPFSTKYFINNDFPTSGYIPGYTRPNDNAGINVDQLNPFQTPNDIEFYTWGSTYIDVNAYSGRAVPDENNTRALALRGPLVVSGWGFSLDGSPVPSGGDGNFVEGCLQRSNLWPTGPVDLLFDKARGVWTSHDLLIGSITGMIPPQGWVYMNTEDGTRFKVYNFSSTKKIYSSADPPPTDTQPEPLNIIAGYVCNKNQWYVVSADCQ